MSRVVIDEEVEKLLREIAVEEGITNAKIEKLDSWIKGENYMGQVTPVQISNGAKTVQVMVKTAAKSDKLRENAPINMIYEREIDAYNKILPIMRKFEVSRGILNPIAGRTKCYKASMIQKQETLIMENLKKQGFALANRKEDLNHDYVKLIMENYGRFHAVSFAIRDQEPETWKTICNSVLPDIFDEFVEKGDFQQMMKKSLDAIEGIFDNDVELKKFFQKYQTRSKQFMESIDSYGDKRFSLFLHGDSWTNNMLFKYEDSLNPKKPTDMRMIDFQIVRVGSPVLELSYILYSCASKEIYNKLDDYLKIYHDTFCSYLKTLGTDPKKAITLEQLKQEWKDVGQYGLYMSTILIKVRLTETEEAVDMAEEADKGKDFVDAFDYKISKIDEYNEKVRNVFKHCMQYGIK